MGKRMKLEDVLIEENTDIRTAVEKLERVRCKVMYVTKNGKLVASISDGDVRRFILRNGDVSLTLPHIANYNPQAFLGERKEEVNKVFEDTDIFSVPIINSNNEIVSIIFRNGNRIDREYYLNYPVVMMAGGRGTRLYPYTKILPKALIPVGEIPISEMIFNRFHNYGCNDFYILVNHKKNMIQAYYDAIEREYHVTYIKEDKPLGTGGGLFLLKDIIDKDFFLINCDIMIDADYSEIVNIHIKDNNFITIVAAKYSHTVPYGVISCTDEFEYCGMQEKPVNEYLINTGMYLVSHDVLKRMPKEQNISFPELIDIFRGEGEKIGVYCVNESAYMDMGQLEELEKMRKRLDLK